MSRDTEPRMLIVTIFVVSRSILKSLCTGNTFSLKQRKYDKQVHLDMRGEMYPRIEKL